MDVHRPDTIKSAGSARYKNRKKGECYIIRRAAAVNAKKASLRG